MSKFLSPDEARKIAKEKQPQGDYNGPPARKLTPDEKDAADGKIADAIGGGNPLLVQVPFDKAWLTEVRADLGARGWLTDVKHSKEDGEWCTFLKLSQP